MPKPYTKPSKTSLFSVLTFIFLNLSFSNSSPEGVTQRETGTTLPNLTTRQTQHKRSGTGADDGGETDSRLPRRSADQSEERREMEAIMFRMFEDYLLANLDLEMQPPPVNASQPLVPNYMFRLYEQLKVDAGQDKQVKTPSNSYKDETSEKVEETIRGYHVISEKWQRHGHGYLVFNTTSQPLKENITHVELVLYMCPCPAKEESGGNSRDAAEPEDATPSSTSEFINITVRMATKRRRRHGKVHVRVPVASNQSYFPINITKMVQRSFAQRQTILNFSIETSNSRHQNVSLPCQSNRSEDENHPLLVIYENVLPFLKSREYKNYRPKRRASTEQNVTAGQVATMDDNTLTMIGMRAGANASYLSENGTNATDPVSLTPSNEAASSVDNGTRSSGNSTTNSSYPVNCHLRSWYVSFAEMQWQHVILQPLGYYANYCWGLCSSVNGNSTNHANARRLYMLLKVSDMDLPKPFCSPIRMAPLQMLYNSKYNVTITKRFKDMIVAGCYCM